MYAVLGSECYGHSDIGEKIEKSWQTKVVRRWRVVTVVVDLHLLSKSIAMVVQKVLSSYYTIGSQARDILLNASVTDAHGWLRWFLLDVPVVPVLLIFHTLYAADRIHTLTGGRQFWFKSLILTTFGAFGGSTMSAVLSGQPAPLFTNASNVMFAYIIVAWYLVDQSRLVRQFVRTRPFNAVLAFGATAAKARAIFGFMDAYVKRFPGAIAGAVALGGLSGSGGALFLSLEKKARRGVHTPSELSEPGWAFKSAYLVAMLYYLAIDASVLRALPVRMKYSISRDDARFLLSLSLCLHAAFETLLGRNVNPTYLLDSLFYTITGVRFHPVPEPTIPTTGDDVSSSSTPEAGQEKKFRPIPTQGVVTSLGQVTQPRQRKTTKK
jgi:TRIC channel